MVTSVVRLNLPSNMSVETELIEFRLPRGEVPLKSEVASGGIESRLPGMRAQRIPETCHA